MAKGW